MRVLPQFPLQMVVFPGEKVNLHIFEPRYKELILECQEDGTTFGIPAVIDKKVMTFGAEMKLIKIEKIFKNGELDIKTQAVGAYKVKDFISSVPGKLYAGADIEHLVIEEKSDIILAQKVIELLSVLYKTMNIKKELPNSPSNLKTYNIAHHIGCNIKQEYEILSIPDEIGRLNYVIEHLERLIPVVEDMEMLRKKVQMNGHFKNVIPPKI